MTVLLEQALAEMQRLFPVQDAIAALILEESADKVRWDQAFAQSSNALARLAQQARVEKQTDKAKLMGFGN
jgi:hypothetical protein